MLVAWWRGRGGAWGIRTSVRPLARSSSMWAAVRERERVVGMAEVVVRRRVRIMDGCIVDAGGLLVLC
jgi:hypothetical protein